MSARPYVGLFEAAMLNAVTCLAPALANLTDDAGQPISIPIRANYSQDDAVFSEVVVTLKPGKITFYPGKNLQKYDESNNLWVYGVNATESSIILTVKARNNAERFFVTDALVSGIMASYISSGVSVEEGYILDDLAACGIIVGGFGELQFPDPSLDEARPEGQVYEAVIPVLCDIWLTWNSPGWQPSDALVSQQVQAFAGLPPVVSEVIDLHLTP